MIYPGMELGDYYKQKAEKGEIKWKEKSTLRKILTTSLHLYIYVQLCVCVYA